MVQALKLVWAFIRAILIIILGILALFNSGIVKAITWFGDKVWNAFDWLNVPFWLLGTGIYKAIDFLMGGDYKNTILKSKLDSLKTIR